MVDLESQDKEGGHSQRYYFGMSMLFVAVFLVALGIGNLTSSYNNPTRSPIVGFLWFLVIVVPVSWAWQVKVGKPYGVWIKRHPKNKWARFYLALPLLILIAGFFVYSQYQSSLEPVSFTASNFAFVTRNGAIEVHTDIKVTSEPTTVQVDVAIDGLDDGICGYSFPTNHTVACIFSNDPLGKPLVTCTELSQAQNHTLTLFAGFSNGKTVTNSYSFTRVQLGCT